MTGEDPGGGVQMPPQGIPELLPGYIIPILGSVHNDNPPTTTAGIFQLRFGFIAYSFLWGPYPPPTLYPSFYPDPLHTPPSPEWRVTLYKVPPC